MNKTKETEIKLNEYKTLIAEIKNIDIEITELEYNGCTGISYEEKTSRNNQFSSVVENEMLSRRETLDKLTDVKFKKENQVKKIENAIESLDERSREIVKLKYFERLSNKVIAIRLDLTEEWIWKLKNDAIIQVARLI